MTQSYYEVWYTDNLEEKFDICTWSLWGRFEQGIKAYECAQGFVKEDNRFGDKYKYVVLHVELLNYYTSGE